MTGCILNQTTETYNDRLMDQLSDESLGILCLGHSEVDSIVGSLNGKEISLTFGTTRGSMRVVVSLRIIRIDRSHTEIVHNEVSRKRLVIQVGQTVADSSFVGYEKLVEWFDNPQSSSLDDMIEEVFGQYYRAVANSLQIAHRLIQN